MNIAYAPSKLAWRARRFIARVIKTYSFIMPPINRYYKRKQVEEIYNLARRAAKRSFPIAVVDSGWATQRCLADKNYRSLTLELLGIDKMSGALCAGGIYRSLHFGRRYEYPYALINSKLPVEPSKEFKILDCGAGVGPMQFYLAMRGYEVYSFDLNLKSLKRVADFKSKKRLKTLHPTYGNILDLPFPDDYFDRVLSISVLEHIVYQLEQDTNIILRGFLNELVRVLKPKGLVVLTFDVNMNPQKSHHRLYYKEYEQLCEILGIPSKPPPKNRLYSSDTEEGRMMGEDICVYCAILTHNSLSNCTNSSYNFQNSLNDET